MNYQYLALLLVTLSFGEVAFSMESTTTSWDDLLRLDATPSSGGESRNKKERKGSNPFEDEQILIDANLARMRAIREIRYEDGARREVQVRATPRDGDCGFHSNDMDRDHFVDMVVAATMQYDEDSAIGKRFWEIFSLIRVEHSLKDVQEWVEWFKKRVGEDDPDPRLRNHAAEWLDVQHLRLLSLLFGRQIFLYRVHPDQYFVEAPECPLIDETQGEVQMQVHMVHVPLLENHRPNHFERLEFIERERQEAAPLGVAPMDLAADNFDIDFWVNYVSGNSHSGANSHSGF